MAADGPAARRRYPTPDYLHRPSRTPDYLTTVAAMAQETPQHIAQRRQVTAELILAGRFDIRQYPHRHVAVVAMEGVWYGRLATVLAAVDLLTPAGFELVTVVEFKQGHAVCAVLRRS